MSDLISLGKAAKKAAYTMALLKDDEKREALIKAADGILAGAGRIISANDKDMEAARAKGTSPAMLDRLVLNEKKIGEMARGMKEVAELPDPNGQLMETIERPNGLIIEKRRVPVGVIAIIYESRPNVTADAFALTFRSGNAWGRALKV